MIPASGVFLPVPEFPGIQNLLTTIREFSLIIAKLV
jgi:hypothetical protein